MNEAQIFSKGHEEVETKANGEKESEAEEGEIEEDGEIKEEKKLD